MPQPYIIAVPLILLLLLLIPALCILKKYISKKKAAKADSEAPYEDPIGVVPAFSNAIYGVLPSRQRRSRTSLTLPSLPPISEMKVPLDEKYGLPNPAYNPDDMDFSPELFGAVGPLPPPYEADPDKKVPIEDQGPVVEVPGTLSDRRTTDRSIDRVPHVSVVSFANDSTRVPTRSPSVHSDTVYEEL